MAPILKPWIFVVAIILGLTASHREVNAQATYVGTFAMTNGKTIKCPTSSSSTFNGLVVVQNPWAAVPIQEWAFFLLPNGYYAIMNIQTTQFMTSFVGGLGGSSYVGESQWTAALDQMWYLYPLGKNFYALVNVNDGKVLTDPNIGNTSGGSVAVNQWTDNLDQWWYLYFLYK